jgi:hypothetical protein
MEDQILETGMDIFLPVMESATVLAAHYAKACGRDVVLAEDMKYGLMYAARNVTGKHLGSLYPEVYEDEDSRSESEGDPDGESDPNGSDSASSWETVSDSELVWARYEGTDELALKLNECADTWDAWEPESPAERAIKNAIEKGK